MYRFVSCQISIPIPAFLMPGQRPSSGKHKQQGWLAGWLAGYLLAWSPAPSLSLSKAPTHWLYWIVLRCTLRRAGLCHQQVKLRQALLLGCRPFVEMVL